MRNFCIMIKSLFYYFMLSIHLLISASNALELKRCPSSQFPDFASCSSNSPLWPNPDDAEVQNEITVFPAKSFAFTFQKCQPLNSLQFFLQLFLYDHDLFFYKSHPLAKKDGIYLSELNTQDVLYI